MHTPPPFTIGLNGLGKKFGNEWIFKNITTSITQGEKMVILGGNGSGKSTLLQIIAGYILPNQGSVTYSNGQPVEPEDFRNYISLASPYLEIVEEFSLPELIEHCAIYKPFLNKMATPEIVGLTGLAHAGRKPIKTYSSGMRQRVKLSLAILADCPVLLLDEPVSNLDRTAIGWYKELMAGFAGGKTVIVCSNSISEEYAFCNRELNLADHKGRP